jgi:hypothetical protein
LGAQPLDVPGIIAGPGSRVRGGIRHVNAPSCVL